MQSLCGRAMQQRLLNVFNRKWIKVVALVAGCLNGLTFTELGFFPLFFFNHTITPIFGYTYDPTMETFNCYRLFAAIARKSFVLMKLMEIRRVLRKRLK